MAQAHSQYETHSGQEEAIRTILYSDQEAPSKSELENRYAVYNDPCNIAESVYKIGLQNSLLDLLIEIPYADLKSKTKKSTMVHVFISG